MSLRDAIRTGLKQAMRAQEPVRLGTLRLINAAIKDRDIDARAKGQDDGVEDSEILAILG